MANANAIFMDPNVDKYNILPLHVSLLRFRLRHLVMWIFNHCHLVSVAGRADILTDYKSVHIAQLPPALKLR